MTPNTCATCAHARPHGVGYVECQIATRRLGEPVRFYCQTEAACYFDRGWKARPVDYVAMAKAALAGVEAGR